jgi:hypothetical protein
VFSGLCISYSILSQDDQQYLYRRFTIQAAIAMSRRAESRRSVKNC